MTVKQFGGHDTRRNILYPFRGEAAFHQPAVGSRSPRLNPIEEQDDFHRVRRLEASLVT